MRLARMSSIFVSAALGMALTACGTPAEKSGDGPTGAIELAVSGQGLTNSSIVTVAIGCNQSNGYVPYSGEYTIPVGNDLASARARFENLPVGTCDFDVAVYETPDTTQPPTFTGSRTGVTITSGLQPNLIIVLHGQGSADPFGNGAPYITSLIVSTLAIEPGGEVYLEVSAEDPDGDPITYQWTKDGGDWVDSDGTDDFVFFTASGLNLYHLGVIVSDDKGASASIADLAIDVQPVHGTGTIETEFDLQFNHGPAVTSITVTQTDAASPSFDPIRVHALTAVANDPEGSGVTYAWSADASCGMFLVDNAGTPAWSGTAQGSSVLFNAIAANGCNVSVTVTDSSGAFGTGTINLRKIEEAIDIEPSFKGAFQSAISVAGGKSVNLAVDVVIPFSTELPLVNWATNGVGTVTGTTLTWIDPGDPTAGSRMTAVWTAPACFSTFADITVSAEDSEMTVWNSHTFTIDGADASCP